MSEHKGAAAKPTTKKAGVAARVPKSKIPANATAKRGVAAKKAAASSPSAAVPSVPDDSVKKAGSARKAATRKRESEVDQAVRAPRMPGDEKHADLSGDERHRWIATAAYHRALERGFAPGHEVQDWLEAEAAFTELVLRTRSE